MNALAQVQDQRCRMCGVQGTIRKGEWMPGCLCFELYTLAERTKATRRQRNGAFGGLDPTRPAYIAPYFKVAFIQPRETLLYGAWLGVTSNQLAILDALALDLWEAPESVVVLLTRIPSYMRESCALTFHYFFTDVERVVQNMERQVAGGAAPTQYRVEPVRGPHEDFGIGIFTGQGRVPPIIDGFSQNYFLREENALSW